MFSSLVPVVLATSAVSSAQTDVSGFVPGGLTRATVYATCQSTYEPSACAYRLVYGIEDEAHGTAWGSFDDAVNRTGYGELSVRTGRGGGGGSNYGSNRGSNETADRVQMYAAGYVEAALTRPRVLESIQNFAPAPSPNASADALHRAKLAEFVQQQEDWARSAAAAGGTNSSSRGSRGASPALSIPRVASQWRHVQALLDQFDGLVAGMAATAPSAEPPLPRFALQSLQVSPDEDAILKYLFPGDHHVGLVNWAALTGEEWARKVRLALPCSALVKATADLSELFAAQATWMSYGILNKVYKHYDFSSLSQDAGLAAPAVSFSSYPGALASHEDFYLMRGSQSQLVMLQTTNGMFNNTEYGRIRTDTLPTWLRVRSANALARGGQEWAQLLRTRHSGTYMNQYMLVDYTRFLPGRALLDGALRVVEETPSLVEDADATPQLRLGYWPSYNVPYFESVYNLSGYPALVRAAGPRESYDMAPRAQIFRRDQASVTDLASMQRLMRSNGYKSGDPITRGDPTAAVCARGDLLEHGAEAGGCIDAKVTSRALFVGHPMAAQAVAGPTTAEGTLPPFSWAAFAKLPGVTVPAHAGSPVSFNFSFTLMAPAWSKREPQA